MYVKRQTKLGSVIYKLCRVAFGVPRFSEISWELDPGIYLSGVKDANLQNTEKVTTTSS